MSNNADNKNMKEVVERLVTYQGKSLQCLPYLDSFMSASLSSFASSSSSSSFASSSSSSNNISSSSSPYLGSPFDHKVYGSSTVSKTSD